LATPQLSTKSARQTPSPAKGRAGEGSTQPEHRTTNSLRQSPSIQTRTHAARSLNAPQQQLFPLIKNGGRAQALPPFQAAGQTRRRVTHSCADDQAARLALAFSASAPNATASRTARSASTLRSMSMAAFFRPSIRRL